MYTWKNPSSSQVSGLVHSGGMVWEKVFTSPSALAIKKQQYELEVSSLGKCLSLSYLPVLQLLT